MKYEWLEILEKNSIEFFNKFFDLVSSLASSNLFSIIISTLFAAFAGAYGAQFIVENNRKKELLQKEIRNTNAAIMIAMSISNTSLSLKNNM